jgi:NTP pyrophosphatase (non-canonical NTP hydrolase)
MSEQKPYITPDLEVFIGEQFDHLTQLFPDLYGNHEMLAYAAIAKLSEEMGELSEAVLKDFQRQRKTKEVEKNAIPKELADVLVVTLLLAKQFDIDVNEALREKIMHLQQRRSSE